MSGASRRAAILLLGVTLPFALAGCAGRLGTAPAAGERVQPATANAAALPGPVPGSLVVSAEQILPGWLADATQLFARATDLPVALPTAAALESRAIAGSDTPIPVGDVRWVDSAEACALGKSGDVAAVPPELAATLAAGLTGESFAAFEQAGRHWGVPLCASWLGLLVDTEALPIAERGTPPTLEDWLAQLRRIRAASPAAGTPPAAPLWVAWDEPGCADTFALLVAAMGGRLFDERGLPVFAEEGDAGSRALALMVRLLQEGFVPKNALETHASDLPASLTKGHAFWIGWSEVLEDALTGEQRRGLLRRLGQLQPSAFPVDGKIYSYTTRPAALLVRYRGLAVSAKDPSATAWKLASFIAHPLVLDAATQLSTVLRTPAPPSGAFATQSRALLGKESQLARWELAPSARLTLGRFVQAALKKTLPEEEALTRAAQALGAPPPATTLPPNGLTPPLSTPTVTGIPAPSAGTRPGPGASTASPKAGSAPPSSPSNAEGESVVPGASPYAPPGVLGPDLGNPPR